jgi:hypothetical protein
MQLLDGARKKLFFIFILLSALVVIWLFLFTLDFSQDQKPDFGVTFSQKYALDLELDWRQTYLAILDDLKVSHLRLIAYWDELEKNQDQFDFIDLDWQIAEAEKRRIAVVLVVGRRAPRWPECHDPSWLINLAPLAIEQQQLEYLKAVIDRYRLNQSITIWQIENEPLFAWFGQCPKPAKQFLKKEIDLVKSLDSRPVMITDSGELSHWQNTASVADILGTTMYRIVWHKKFGFWDYWFLPAAFYRLKAEVTKFFHRHLENVIVTELQMEPWTMDRRMIELSLADQQKSFNLKRFQHNIDYVKKTGLSPVYLWGVEYWYWLKQNGHSNIWQTAKRLWQ